MQKLKDNILKIVNSKYFPFIAMAIIMLGIHLFTYSNGDDDFFRIQLDNQNIIEYLKIRYNTWSSRIFVEILFVTISRLPLLLWQILDTLIFTSIGILISKIFNKKNSQYLNWIIVGLLLIYPFTDMSSAGYVCTSIAYIWTTASLLYVLYIFIKVLEKNNLKYFEYILSFICLLLAISFEQTLSLFIGFTLVILLYLFIKKEFDLKRQGFILLYFLISLAMLIFTMKCPGNDVRYLAEVNYWFPEYKNFGLLSKIYLGIVPTMAVLLRNKVVISIFSFMLFYTIIKGNHNIFNRVLAFLQLTFFLTFGLFKDLSFGIFPSLARFYEIINLNNAVPTLTFNYLIPLGITTLVFIVCLYLIYIAFAKKLTPAIIFCASVASRFIMGFSPTIYASVDRTAFFMYIGIIVIIFLLIKEIFNKEQKLNNLISYTLTSISLFNVLNIIYTLIIVKENLYR